MSQTKRFYIFTGKGGVGKTTLSLAFAKYLKKQNKKCLYTCITSNKIQNKKEQLDQSLAIAQEMQIPILELNLVDCSRNYIAKKLKSETIAKWIVKTPFYQSLINMIPGFSYVIYLGQIIELLQDDPELTIILDSPSSGHALTMLEATQNFKDIFKSGMIYEDTGRMLSMLKSPHFTKINIVTIATQLAVNEAIELKNSIGQLEDYECHIVCNNVLGNYLSSDMPDFLSSKINNELRCIENNSQHIKYNIPYSTHAKPTEILKEIVPSQENLV